MVTFRDIMPPDLLKKLEAWKKLQPAQRVNGVINRLKAANNGDCKPTEEWLNLLQEVNHSLQHAKKSKELILELLTRLVRETFFPAVKTGMFSYQNVSRIVDNLIECGVNGQIQQEALDLLERQRRIEDANFRILVGATLAFQPTQNIVFSSNWGQVERQPIQVDGDGIPQCRLKLTAQSGRYTVWAVKATGELVMLAGEGLISGVKRPFLRQITEDVLRIFVEKVVNASVPAPVPPTLPEAAPEPLVAAPESPALPPALPPAPVISNDSSKTGLSALFTAVVNRLEGTNVELSDNITVERQKVETLNGLSQCRLRFDSKSGYTVLAVTERGKVYIFPGGQAFPPPLNNKTAKEWVLKALKALAAI